MGFFHTYNKNIEMADTTKIAADIREILKALGPEGRSYKGILQSLEQTNAGVDEYKTLLKSVQDVLRDLNNDLDNTFNSWKNINNELNKAYSSVSLTKKGFGEYYKISNQLLYNQENLANVSKKELESLQKKAELNKKILEQQLKSLETKKSTVGLDPKEQATYDNLVGVFKNITGEIDITNNALQRQLKDIKAINGAVGLTGNLFKGISQIPGLNKISGYLNVDKANETMREYAASQLEAIRNSNNYQKTLGQINRLLENDNLSEKTRNKLIERRNKLEQESRDKIDNNLTRTKALYKGLSVLIEGLYKGLLDPATLIITLLKELVDAFKLVDGLTGDLAKNMNMSYQDASTMSSELNSAANASGDIFVTTKGMQESLLAINKTLGTNVMLNKEDLATMTKFRTVAGLTNEELAGIYKLTLGTNKSLEDATGEVLAQATISSTRLGVALNEKEVLKEIKDISAATTLSLGKDPKLIAEAVAVAKSLGIEMSKIDAIAESLLNFQSSIESELEAELLTGRQLNLEQARYYALTNNVAGLAEEINKNLGSSAEFGKMNRLQQDAIAKSVGMNREELAKTLFIQDQLKDVSGDEVEKRRELLNSLTEQYGVEGAQKMLKEKSIEDLENQASIQDRFNASVEKLREIFVTVAEALMPVFDIFGEIFKIVGPIVGAIGSMVKLTIQLGKYLLPIYGLYKAIQAIQVIQLYTALSKRDVELFGLNKVKQELAVREGMNLQEKIQLGYRKSILFFSNAEYRTEVLKNIQKGIGNALTKAGNLFKKGGLIYDIGSAFISTVGAVMSFLGKILGPFAIPVALAAGAGIAAAGYKYMKGDDVVSPGYGKRTLMAPEGAIQLNDKDTIIAGTNLEGNKSKESTSIMSPSINIQPLIDEMVAVRTILTSILNKEGNVSIDGNIVGKTLALAQYNTGS